LAVAATVLLLGAAAQGAVYQESFDFDTTSPAADYPAFSASLGTGTAQVSGGELDLTQPAGSSAQRFTRGGFAMPHTVSALLESSPGGGGYNVGLIIGDNSIVFHPGFAGGALRVEGPGGFGNTNVGFTPAANVAHQLDVAADGHGQFDLRLTDGNNPSNVFTATYTNPGAVGGDIGFRRQGNPGTGRYDDLTVSSPARALYAETFETDFNFTTGGLSSANGVLQLDRSGAGDPQHWTHAGPAGAYTLTADVGADNSNGSYNVGLVVGQNLIIFHPGLAGGAFRVDGPGGFGNTNMGFTPANNVLHQMQISHDGAGNFNITVTDGANPANTFNASFSNAGSIGGDIGFRRSGPDVGIGLYDNLSVTPASGRPTLDSFDNRFATNLNGGSADVVNGVLELSPAADGNSVQLWDVGSFHDNLLISAEIGARTDTPGNFNVGLTVGQNNIVFHPGFAGGALRVEGPGGFGNNNVGFTPALDMLHLLEVRQFPNGLYEITLTDRNDPFNNVFTAAFINPGSVGGPIALRRSGGTTGPGLYDNLVIQHIPEPATLTLIAFGAGALLRRRRARA
jgi:hypothetical protein